MCMCGKRCLFSCRAWHVWLTVLAILVALAVTFLLTYFLTKNHFKPKENNEEEEEDDDGPTAAELRLPRSVWPVEYTLTLKTFLPGYVDFPHEKDFKFDATVEMKLYITEAIDKIVLNMKNISIHDTDCKLTLDGQEVSIRSITPQERLEKVEVLSAETLEKGKDVTLKLVYTGNINDKLYGLYQTRYFEDGREIVAASTHMEPVSARLMVPCFDEPEYRAKWQVTVTHPKGTTAISNGIEESTETNGNWTTTKFQQTPSMSSYLIALMVSEFEYVEGTTESKKRYRVYAKKEASQANMTEYALSVGIKCLDYYDKLFGIPFPLEKQDMVALPDFSAGAMENWGMITYRENSLLYDKKLYGPENKRRIVQVVAHELGHMWFGDLVTLKWWNDLWLNEGFASYVEFFGADEISNKQMKLPEYFLVEPLTKGLERDSVSASHPLSFKIDKASEVSEAFDSISYDKGAAVLKMLANIVGEENFFKAIKLYLEKYKYGNTEAADLWRTFDEVTKIKGPDGEMTVFDYADQWTSQMAFPLVTVNKSDDTHVKLTQKRYCKTPNSPDPEKYRDPKYGFKWDIPIWYKVGDDEEKFAWLGRAAIPSLARMLMHAALRKETLSRAFKEKPLDLEITNAEQPVVINVNRTAFFRQNHDSEGWQKLSKQLSTNHEIYNAMTRNGIISDAFAAALIGEVPYETIFNLIKYIKKEKEYLPWQEAINGFSAVLKYFDTEPEAEYAEKFFRDLLKPAYESTSLDKIADNYEKDTNDSLFYQVLFDKTVVEAYCSFGSQECIDKYAKLFQEKVVQLCKNSSDKPSVCSSVAAPLRAKTYCYGVREGGEAAFNKVYELYLSETVALEKDILRRALGCHKDVRTLKKLLQLALDHDPSIVKLQDVADIFNSVSGNPAGQGIMLNFLLDRWDEIYSKFMPWRKAVAAAIKASAAGIHSQRQIDQVKYLRKNGKHAKDFGDFNTVIEEAQHRIDWNNKYFHDVAKYFEEQVRNQTSILVR